MLVHRFLEDSACRQPDATALIEDAHTVTYSQLDRLANRYANLFRAAGVKRHDRVVIALENCTDMVAAYLGAMKAGGVAVPLPAGPRSDRLRRAITDCTPAAAVVDPATALEADADHPLTQVPAVFVDRRGRQQQGSSTEFEVLHDALAAVSDAAPGVRSINIDLAAIIYTSGSTGEARGVMLSHRNMVSNARSIVRYLQLTAADRVMCVLPFYYVYGLSLLHTHLAVGGSIVIDNRFTFPNVVLRAMRQHAVTGFAGVPSTFALLLHRSGLSDVDLPTLRYATQAGGGMAPAAISDWLTRGWQVPFYVMYGATEASARLAYLEPGSLGEKLGAIGKAIPNVEIQIVRDDGSPARPGEVGQLLARGSNISRGYWNNPHETARRFRPQGYLTGDLGYMDEDGVIFLAGRLHDMIKVGAHRVGAKEIEDVLCECPGVQEAAVVAAPHDLLGEVPIAFLSMRQDSTVTTEALHAFCRSRLPAHKVPAHIVLRDDLPKLGAVGKLDKASLREIARHAFAMGFLITSCAPL